MRNNNGVDYIMIVARRADPPHGIRGPLLPGRLALPRVHHAFFFFFFVCSLSFFTSDPSFFLHSPVIPLTVHGVVVVLAIWDEI